MISIASTRYTYRADTQDLRRRTDELAGMVRPQFYLDSFQQALFLFYRRRKDQIKELYLEDDGFMLPYELESGSYQWTRKVNEPPLLPTDFSDDCCTP